MTRKYLDDGIKVTKTTLEFGPLKIYRLPAVPANDFGRNGDIAIIDDTAVPLIEVASGLTPTVTNLCQKVGGVWVCGLGGGGGASIAYGRIAGGDGGVAAASVAGDTITVNGTGINVAAVDAGSPLDALNLALDVADLSAGVGPLTVGDEIAVNDGGTTFRFTFTQMIGDLGLLTATNQSVYTTIGGDTGTATASGNTDQIDLIGATNGGITTLGAEGAPDTVTFAITPIDLATGAATLTTADYVIISDSADAATITAQKYPLSKVVDDLNIVYGIASNGIIVRTANDVYATRSILASGAGDEDGLVVTNGSGVAGNPTVGLDIVGLPARSDAVDGADRIAVWNSTAGANEYYLLSDILAAGAITDAFSFVAGGDGGTTAAAIGADTITVNGTGISVTTANGAAGLDTLDLVLDVADLTAGAGIIALADEIAVNDGGTTVRYTFTDLVQDLDVPYGIAANGLITRTAADTYTSRSIAISGAGAEDGLAITDGDGVAGNPTLGLDINGLPARSDAVDTDDKIAVYNLTSGANEYYTVAELAGSVSGADSFKTWLGAGNTSGDASVVADSSADTVTVTGGTGININFTALTDIVEWEFARVGMADTAVQGADTVPFFDATSSNEPEYRSWTDIITDLGLLTSGNQVVFTSVTGDTGTATADTNTDSVAFVGATNGGITTTGSDGPEQVTFGITPIDLVTGSATLAAGDFIVVSDSTDSATTLAQKYTFQDVIDDLNLTVGGVTNAYSSIAGGDGGTTAAAIGSDTITFNGEGINITTANGGAGLDTVAFDLDVSDLTAGTTVALTDVIAVDQGADPNVKFSFTDVVEDLDVPYGITADGLVTRTAADTYASRTIVASSNEDELGAAVANGDGVAGNPTVGVDILGLTDPGAEMAATDEFIVHDKSEGTAGANRKITGQNIADGALTLIGLEFSTLDGEIVLTFNDTTRTKRLSVETVTVMWNDPFLSANEYLDLGGAANADAGFLVPHDATLVKATGVVADNNGNSRDIDLYVNGALDTASILSFTGASGQDSDSDVALDIDFSAGDIVHLRGDSSSGGLDDVVVVLFMKWRAP